MTIFDSSDRYLDTHIGSTTAKVVITGRNGQLRHRRVGQSPGAGVNEISTT
jgi:hypothetical protein